MKQINKIHPPKLFVEFCAKPHAIYDGSDFPKEELKQNLLTEQGHICCYCMKRIPQKIVKDGTISYEMKIEHYKGQDNYPALQLNYSNLLGACTGNEGYPKKLQTCDTKKENTEITINPISTNPSCESFIKYLSNGEIHSDDPKIEYDLNILLNLNMQTLVDGRREVYEEVQKKVESESKKCTNNKIKTKYFEKELEWWQSRDRGKFKPYCLVAVYYLKRKIRQNQN